MNKLKLNVSDLDYTKIERPVEPAFENEDPEGWCEVLAWEEARADKLEKENAELLNFVKMIANGMNEDPESAVIHLRVHSKEAKKILNKQFNQQEMKMTTYNTHQENLMKHLLRIKELTNTHGICPSGKAAPAESESELSYVESKIRFNAIKAIEILDSEVLSAKALEESKEPEQVRTKESTAIRTLEVFGYEYKGGEFWEPPVKQIKEPEQVEWKNGDECVYMVNPEGKGAQCDAVFIAYHPHHPVVVIDNSQSIFATSLDNIKKKETPEQKKERELLEAAHELYNKSTESNVSFDYFDNKMPDKNVRAWIKAVEITGYCKPE